MSFANFTISCLNRVMARVDKPRLASQALPKGVSVESDIPYLDGGGRDCLFDVYRPEGASGELPVILDIHGGGLFYGDKDLNKNYNMNLAKRGFVVLSFSYPLVPTVTLPEELAVLYRGICAAGAQLSRFGGDPENVFLTGDSAGALLAISVAHLAQNAQMRKVFEVDELPFSIRKLGLVSGMFNLFGLRICRFYSKLLFEKKYTESVYFPFFNFSNMENLSCLPEMYLLSSEQDELKSMTLWFHELLKIKNVAHEFRYVNRGTERKLSHVFSILYPEYPESCEVIDEMLEFFLKTSN